NQDFVAALSAVSAVALSMRGGKSCSDMRRLLPLERCGNGAAAKEEIDIDGAAGGERHRADDRAPLHRLEQQRPQNLAGHRRRRGGDVEKKQDAGKARVRWASH